MIIFGKETIKIARHPPPLSAPLPPHTCTCTNMYTHAHSLTCAPPLAEIFWENVGLTPNEGCERGMDQCKVNFAFDRMGLNWTIVGGTLKQYDLDTEWFAKGDVTVRILPLRTICRQRFCVEETIGEREREIEERGGDGNNLKHH